MCGQSILSKKGKNAVVFCGNCNEFQVYFGNVLLKMKPNIFNLYIEKIHALDVPCNEARGDECETFAVPSLSEHMWQLFSKQEFEDYKQLITDAMFVYRCELQLAS